MTTDIKLPAGYKLIANYNDKIVLAQSLNEENPEPYVTWMVHDFGVHTGCYFAELSQAQLSFAERAFGLSEIIAEPILGWGASKDDVKVAQMGMKKYHQYRKSQDFIDGVYRERNRRQIKTAILKEFYNGLF